jgi:hypothetical protein
LPLKRLLLAGFVHVLPLAPLAFGHPMAALAAALIVASCYIKTMKLHTTLRYLEGVAARPLTAAGAKELASLRRARDFWRWPTFLPTPPDAPSEPPGGGSP